MNDNIIPAVLLHSIELHLFLFLMTGKFTGKLANNQPVLQQLLCMPILYLMLCSS